MVTRQAQSRSGGRPSRSCSRTVEICSSSAASVRRATTSMRREIPTAIIISGARWAPRPLSGLAWPRPSRRKVAVITGDGEQFMGLGGLATIAVARPKNLTIVVIDNGRYGETGMQLSHTGFTIDLARIAAACGFVDVRTIDTLSELSELRQDMHREAAGPRFFVLKVAPETVERSLPFRDAVHGKNRFRAHLGLPVS